MSNKITDMFPPYPSPFKTSDGVEFVPVVRCKECDHASWRDIDGGVWKCKMAMGDEYHNDDFYCAWGERGEDGLDSDSTLGNP